MARTCPRVPLAVGAALMVCAGLAQSACGGAQRPTLAAAAAAAATDRYGDPLPARVVSRLGTLRLRHHDSVIATAFSADGRRFASASADRTVVALKPLIAAHARSAAPAIRAWIEDLDSDVFDVRDQAHDALLRAGKGAVEQLTASRIIMVLEWIASAEARALLEQLAKGDRDAALTEEARASLQRLALGRHAQP